MAVTEWTVDHLLDAEHLRADIELQHVLHAVAQSDNGGGAARARALQLELHDALLERLRAHECSMQRCTTDNRECRCRLIPRVHI